MLWLALTSFVILGLADSGLGVAWPSMRSVFDRGLPDLGLLLATLSVGYLAASSAFGWLHARSGTGNLLVAGALSLGLGVLVLVTAESWLLVPISTAVMGVGAGLIDVGMNAHAALEFDRGSMSLLHAAYGVGATMGPLLITLSIAAGAVWRGGYGVVAVAQLLVAFLIWRGRHRWRSGEPEDETSPGAPSHRVIVPAMLAFFLVYTGVEVATGQWAYTLLTDARGVAGASAGVWVALYWAGLTLGRLVSGYVGERIRASTILNSSVVIALAGVGLLWWDPLGMGVLGLPVTGLGLAAVFPTMVSLTPARIGRLRSTRVIGYQLAAANIGAATIPWLLGITAGSLGVNAISGGLFAATTLLGVLHLLIDRAGSPPLHGADL